MTLPELISRLLQQGVQLRVENGRLRFSDPFPGASSELRDLLQARESAIVPLLEEGCKYADVSFGQQRMWFLDQFASGIAAYDNPHATFRLWGPLRTDVMERCLSEAVRRHEPLRTRFAQFNGRPCQVVGPAVPVQLKEIDISRLPEAEREARLAELASKEVRGRFDLAHGPVFRTTIIRVGEQECVLTMPGHHSITDGWSMSVFLRELGVLYEAFLAGRDSPLAPLPLSYAEAAYQQRQRLEGENLEKHLSYWKDKLSGRLPVLNLPFDRPRPPTVRLEGRMHPFRLPGSLTTRIKELSHAEGVTLYTTLLAAFKVLLSRYTGQHDIVVGSPNARRTASKIRDIVGLFLNTMVLRTDLSGEPTYQETLHRVREVTRDAMRHAELPFERLVEELRPDRNTSHSPLFQAFFVFQNLDMHRLQLVGLRSEPYLVDTGRSDYDLTLLIWEKDGGLAGYVQYQTALFDEDTIVRMMHHYEVLLESAVTDPNTPIARLRLLPDEELHRVVHEWNATQTEYRTDCCIHQLFEEQVVRTPGAVSIICENQHLSYTELNHKANQLAHYLRKRGVGPGTLVGVCAERSPEMVAALYGILKAGGAYVPLDPDYPANRIASMVDDARPPIILTQRYLVDRLPQNDAELICLDSAWAAIGRESRDNRVNQGAPEDLAYVMFTSGSTGRPKGVMISHEAICNRLFWMQDTFGLKQGDRVLQKTPFSFDVSVWEFFWPLQTGATLVLARPGGHRDSAYLVRLIRERGITTVHFVPSMLRVFLDEKDVASCTSLKWVICSGEALPYELQERFFTLVRAELHNLYGPTEAAVDVTHWKCSPEYPRPTVPIGRPIANTRIYILDSEMQPAPIGVPGEAHIGGVQVARGYLNRSDLSKERFVPDPFDTRERRRLYKTGDVARFLSDGNIEYLGRMDHQVKVRGCRVELGEIEAVLARKSGVKEVVVNVWDQDSRDSRLAAYLVVHPGQAVRAAELRSFALAFLPEYMTPSAYVFLDALPLMPNGKVDKRALPEPETTIVASDAGSLPPRDPIELQLAHLWEELLNVHPVGVRDNFFELGGHSLMAAYLVNRIEERFGQKLPLMHLFRETTIERLARCVRQDPGGDSHSVLVPIQPSGSRPTFFCVHSAPGTVLCYTHLARNLGTDQPFYGLQAAGVHGEQDPLRQVDAMAARYIEAMQEVQPDGPYYLGGHSAGGIIAFEMAQQLMGRGHQVALLAIMDNPAPIQLRIPSEFANSLVNAVDEGVWLAVLAHLCEYFFGRELHTPYRDLRGLTSEEQVARFVDRLNKADLIPLDILHPNAEHPMVQAFLTMGKANIQACMDYLPQPYPGRVTLFRTNESFRIVPPGTWFPLVWGLVTASLVNGRTSAKVALNMCRKAIPLLRGAMGHRWGRRGGAMGWDKLSLVPVEVHAVPGNHVTMLTDPCVKQMAVRLRQCMDDTRAATGRTA